MTHSGKTAAPVSLENGIQSRGINDDPVNKQNFFRPGTPQKFSLDKHADQRIHLSQNEIVEVVLDSRELDPNRDLVIRTGDGNENNGAIKIRFKPWDFQKIDIDFQCHFPIDEIIKSFVENQMNITSLVKIKIAVLFLCVLVPFQVLADFSQEAKDLFDSQMKYQKGSLIYTPGNNRNEFPALLRQIQGNRSDKIKELEPLIRELVYLNGESSYNPGLIIDLRKKLLETAELNSKTRFSVSGQVNGLKLIESDDGTTILKDGEFNLRIYGNGLAFRITNEKNNYGKYENSEGRYSEKEAKQMALEVIKNFKLIPEGDMEQLMFLKTEYVKFTGKVKDPGERTVGTIVHFSRKINGIPVVGIRSSNVVVEFISNSDVYQIFVDWAPVSETNHLQSAVDYNTFVERFSGVLKFREIERDGGIELVASENLFHEVLIDRLFCGYVDLGASYSKFMYMQLGCFVKFFEKKGLKSPQIIMVPVAKEPIMEGAWGDTRTLEKLGKMAPYVVVDFAE